MRKKMMFVVLACTMLCVGCGEGTQSSTDSQADVINEVVSNNIADNLININDNSNTVKDDYVEAGYENELAPGAQEIIDALGVTKPGEVLITNKEYDDRIIYNQYVMVNENKVSFYTHVFYLTKDVFLDELNNPDHYGTILNSDGRSRYIYTYIEDYDRNYDEVVEHKMGTIVE